MGMVVMIRGSKPTFQRGDSHSFIDVTLARESAASKVGNWKVLEEDSLSLHNYIEFEIITGRWAPKKPIHKKKLLRKEEFVGRIRSYPILTSPDPEVKEFMETLKEIHGRAITAAKVDFHGNDFYWWTEEITDIRRQVNGCRRKMMKLRPGRNREEDGIRRMEAEYKEKRRSLRNIIRRKKCKCWKKICDEVEKDVWGEGYKIATRSLKIVTPRVELERERVEEVARALFWTRDMVTWGNWGKRRSRWRR